tara:strand:+ start:1466 stop:2290 length:825 start_codon:yes stop_codon:yes gene_type:complete
MKKKIVIAILTYNSEKIIKKTILAAKKITNDIVILDSYSTDNTIKIIKSFNCKILRKKFVNYSSQRNFLIRKCNKLYEWQLHLDSDEILSKELTKNIKNVIKENNKNFSFLVKRQVFFLNKKIIFGGSSNWHLRLFPSNSTMVEDKAYDQHYISKLKSKNLKGYLYDMNTQNLYNWINTHNKWSELEIFEKKKNTNIKKIVNANLFGNKIERLRFFKNIFYYFPSNIRPFLLFFYKYFFLLGFMDGKVGFYYCFFNSLWFRILNDAKKYELKLK